MESSEERFREVYEQYKSRILGQIYAITGDYHQAEDICQETFLKMYDYMEMLDEEGLNRWLRVVSYNKTCDWLRRRKSIGSCWRKMPPDREGAQKIHWKAIWPCWMTVTPAVIFWKSFAGRMKNGTRS